MSIKIMSLVYGAHIGDPQQKSVLLALADRADDFGYCWPGLENLVFKTELSKPTVKRARTKLTENGWIAVRRRPVGKTNLTNVYKIDIEKLEKSQREAPKEAPNKELADMFEGGQSEPTPTPLGSERTPPWGQSDPPPGVRVTPNTSVNPSVTPSLKDFSSELASQDSDASTKSTELELHKPQRPDVEQACTLLADLIVENGSKRPNITKGWRDAARGILDKDGRSLDQLLAAIRWCQNDEFWRGVIMSMPKLRKQYDRLRLEASRKGSQGHANGRNSDLGTDAHYQRYLERAAAREAEEAAGGLPANLWDRALAIGEMLGAQS